MTLNALASALQVPNKRGRWLIVGLAWAGAMLSKYHGVFLPVGTFAYLLVEPSARRVLRLRGPYIAFALGTLGFLPVIFWNAGHGWASFAFQGGRAAEGLRFRPDALLAALGGQALYLLPWVWAFVVVSLVRAIRKGRGRRSRRKPVLPGRRRLPPLVAFFGGGLRPRGSCAALVAHRPGHGRLPAAGEGLG